MATLGRTTNGTTPVDIENALYALSCPQTDLTGQEITKISVLLTVVTTSHRTKCCLYNSSGDLLATTNEVTVPAQRDTWTDFTFSTPIAGTNIVYRIGVFAEATTDGIVAFYSAWNGNYSTYYKTGLSYPTLPDPLTSPSNSTSDLSIYLTYNQRLEVSVSALSLTATVNSVVVSSDNSVTVSALALTTSLSSVTVNYDYSTAASALALTGALNTHTPQWGGSFTATVQALTALLGNPTYRVDNPFAVSAIALTATVSDVTFTYDLAITLTAVELIAALNDPNVEAGMSFSVSAQELIAILNEPEVTCDFQVAVSALLLVLEQKNSTLRYPYWETTSKDSDTWNTITKSISTWDKNTKQSDTWTKNSKQSDTWNKNSKQSGSWTKL
jgi:hypothetical protein